jgi:EmrB/QacA subfamily drug resistance transporter
VTLAFVCIACFFAGLSLAALNVAVPVVVRHFHASPVAATWVVLVPQLASTAFMVSFGRLADVIGRRSLFLFGVGGFTAASLLCGAAPNVWLLVTIEVVQSVASGAIFANSAAILIDLFPPARLSHVLGVYIAAASVAELLGPSAGGFIADSLGWRWIYWLNVPVGIACYVWGHKMLPRRAEHIATERLDIAGLLLAPAALAGLIIAMTQSEVWGWANATVDGGLVVAAALLALFIVIERRVRHPVLPLGLFRDRAFSLAMISAFVNSTALFGVVLLIALFLQAGHGDSALGAGLKVTPLAAASALAAAVAGLVIKAGRAQGVALFGSLLAAAGIITLRAAIHSSYSLTAVALAMTGAGLGIFLPFNASAVMDGEVPRQAAGVVNGIRLTLQNAGALLSTVICLALITHSLPAAARPEFFAGNVSRLSAHALPALFAAYDEALTLLCVLALLGTAAAGASWIYAQRGNGPGKPGRTAGHPHLS